MIYGLTDEQFDAILQEPSRFENMTRMVVYGPGATRIKKSGSNVELALKQHIIDSGKTIYSIS